MMSRRVMSSRLLVRHFDADGRGAADALDADRLGLEGQSQIVAEVDDLGVLHAGGRLELERRHDRAGVIGRDLALDRELPAALFDEVADLEELLVDIVVDRVLLRPGGEQIDGRQEVVREPRLALRRRFFRLALHGARHLRLRTRRADGGRIVEVERILELAVVDGPDRRHQPGG